MPRLQHRGSDTAEPEEQHLRPLSCYFLPSSVSGGTALGGTDPTGWAKSPTSIQSTSTCLLGWSPKCTGGDQQKHLLSDLLLLPKGRAKPRDPQRQQRHESLTAASAHPGLIWAAPSPPNHGQAPCQTGFHALTGLSPSVEHHQKGAEHHQEDAEHCSCQHNADCAWFSLVILRVVTKPGSTTSPASSPTCSPAAHSKPPCEAV